MSVKSSKREARTKATRTKAGKVGKVLIESSTMKHDGVVTKDEIQRAKANLAAEHLPPLALTFIVLLCSGALLVLNLRDLLTTGKNIGGSWDEAMLVRFVRLSSQASFVAQLSQNLTFSPPSAPDRTLPNLLSGLMIRKDGNQLREGSAPSCK